jgi:propionate CoA-transferase
MGGMPTAGLDFGAAVNAQAILDQPSQFDFYDGGGLGAAVLGMAQAGRQGNVNVSRFGSRLAGSGGFINISQTAKKLIFVGSFVVPSRSRVQDGRLVVADGAVSPKFLTDVEQRTFSGEYTAGAGQPVLYVTERCVFQLTGRGLELIEIAPWVDLEKDILAHIGFEPIIKGEPRLMDARIFADGLMGLKDDLLTVPLEARFAYDTERNTFFLNMEGMSLATLDDVESIGAEIEKRLAAIGKRCRWSSTTTTSTWHRISPTPTSPWFAGWPNTTTPPSPGTPPAPSCGSSSASSCPTEDWPRTSAKAVRRR